jgi:tRNA and rRNA cytosine-C5-methylases
MYYSHLNTAIQLLQQYNGEQPFGHYIKQYFNAHKKYGSKDRKHISQLCYSYFRLGKALPALSMEEKILHGAERLQHVTDIFPFRDELSHGIDHETFCRSFLVQPDLFLRLRPGKEETVKRKLQAAGIPFEERSPYCLALPNASKADAVIEMDREAVIQDYSSQRVGELMPPAQTIWDACAASGGKSILAYDLLKPTELTVSDIRKSIMVNLEKRFARAGIKNYRAVVTDLARSASALRNEQFDLIIADVPCTGSGTWSRTPEQLYYFDISEIERYSRLQKQIVNNIIRHVKPGGHLLYITCSVFRKENEEVVQHVKGKMERMEVFKGYGLKADTMFAALFSQVKQG